MERGLRCSCEARGTSSFDFHDFFLLDPTLIVGHIYGLDVSPDGSVVVGAGHEVVMAHNTVTCAALWRKEMLGRVWTLRIHGNVVVVPNHNSNIAVLDVTTGQQLHTLPSAGDFVYGVCVFDGLTFDAISFDSILTPFYYVSAANEGSLENG